MADRMFCHRDQGIEDEVFLIDGDQAVVGKIADRCRLRHAHQQGFLADVPAGKNAGFVVALDQQRRDAPLLHRRRRLADRRLRRDHDGRVERALADPRHQERGGVALLLKVDQRVGLARHFGGVVFPDGGVGSTQRAKPARGHKVAGGCILADEAVLAPAFDQSS